MLRYRWTKDEKDLEERQLSATAEDGTLKLEVATETDQGIYQCYASNRYGVAATVKTVLRMAGLQSTDNKHNSYMRISVAPLYYLFKTSVDGRYYAQSTCNLKLNAFHQNILYYFLLVYSCRPKCPI